MNKFANALSAALERCVASKTITEEKQPVGFAYREAPVFEHDSGWRFFRGNETDEYTDNPNNFTVCGINEITDRCPALLPILQETAGAWEADEEGRFVPATDWQPQE
ncbi:DUF2185 domain-containing protein [Neisseria wadsworthii]|uniref:Immunity protein Imm33 domain-containing protein n=1 Tax=Neisseria wadsworthii 9715 TaxID=1030841 RepID=G4CT02_9NEIS|nr:DUF2185 domain-containing protein [Neisseria wadsworthii]EGZ44499.1 hypothetical protein HMPREF9370_2212 [Neisseria wadsworthii 9715]QMT35813.1 DUF2185 domain-containing protein [Neisseria wadsworthii]